METAGRGLNQLPLAGGATQGVQNKNFFIAGWVLTPTATKRLRNQSQETGESRSRSGQSRSSSILKRNGHPHPDVEHKGKNITYQAYLGHKNLAGQPYFGESAAESAEEYYQTDVPVQKGKSSREAAGSNGILHRQKNTSGEVDQGTHHHSSAHSEARNRSKCPLSVDLAISGEEG